MCAHKLYCLGSAWSCTRIHLSKEMTRCFKCMQFTDQFNRLHVLRHFQPKVGLNYELEKRKPSLPQQCHHQNDSPSLPQQCHHQNDSPSLTQQCQLSPPEWFYSKMGSSVSQTSGAVWKWRWPSWAPIPNEPTVSVDLKQHFNQPVSAIWTFFQFIKLWVQSLDKHP